jgi:DNA-binding CsgD family transcriptional regulator
VERHLLNVYAKLGVRSRTEAAGYARANGLA